MKRLISYIVLIALFSFPWWVGYLPKPKEPIKRDTYTVKELNYPRTLKEF